MCSSGSFGAIQKWIPCKAVTGGVVESVTPRSEARGRPSVRYDTCIAGGDVMPLSIRLTPEEEARLDALAARTGRSKTFYVRQAIEAHLDELEERYWADEAVREWEASGKRSRPARELWDELGV